MFGVVTIVTYEHDYKCSVCFFDDSGIVHIELLVVSLLINLLLYLWHQFFSHKILIVCFWANVKYIKNSLCNGFK